MIPALANVAEIYALADTAYRAKDQVEDMGFDFKPPLAAASQDPAPYLGLSNELNTIRYQLGKDHQNVLNPMDRDLEETLQKAMSNAFESEEREVVARHAANATRLQELHLDDLPNASDSPSMSR